MAKFIDKQKKLIAALRNACRTVESLKEQFGATAKQINSYAEKYKDDETFIVTWKPEDKERPFQ
jgi:hypothetical protein